MSIVRKYLVLVFASVIAVQVYGQATRSPFSTFGIGDLYGNALANNQGMGGIGVSQPQIWYANNPNPALLVFNTMTVFHAGIVGEQRKISADTINQKSIGGNLNYLLIALPLKYSKWSTSLALSPYTTVNYKLQYQEDVNNSSDQVNVTEEGEGGITQFSWSNGVRITKNLAVGLKASYLFGSIINNYSNQLINSPQPANYTSAIEERAYVKDFAFTAGVSYSLDSIFNRNRYRLSFGAVYDLATDLNTRRRSIIFRTNSGGSILDPDTITSSKGNISLPSGFTGGISLSRGTRWSIGVEGHYRDWSSFRSVSRDDEGLRQAWRVSLGGETTPDPFAVESYLKRVTYRVGVSMEEYPYLANEKKVKDLGINFGFSLPAGRSSMDLAFRVGKRGDKAENSIQENYFRVFFGVTFNDTWFIKRKFE